MKHLFHIVLAAVLCLLIHGFLIHCPAQADTRIVCLGDSVTRAVRPGVEPDQTFSAVLEQMLNQANMPAKVVNAGVGGHTTADGLARFDRDVLVHQPDLVVIMFGLNDSWIDDGKTTSRVSADQYRDNLLEMISRLRKQNARIVLMTPNPAIAPMYPPTRNVTLKAYVAVVRQIAAEEKLPLVDLYGKFAELQLEGADVNGLFTDAMHPNPAGQKMIAEMLFQMMHPPEKPAE